MATYTPPQDVADNARLALEVRAEKPPSQQGMTLVGLARARQLATMSPVSLDTVQRMASYFARHEVDKQGSTWDERGKGWQAWHGWGGDAGRAWVTKILAEVETMDSKASRRHSAADMKIIRSARKAAQSVASYMTELGDDGMDMDEEPKSVKAMHEMHEMDTEFNTRQRMMVASLVETTHQAGKFDMTAGANGAHYMGSDNNPFMAKGLCCAHCYFYQPEYNCAIVAGVIDPMGLCKLWVIPEAVIITEPVEAVVEAVAMYHDDHDDDDMSKGGHDEDEMKLTDAERDALPDSAFALRNERKFPVVTPVDVYDAWLTWHNYRGNTSFETFKENLIAIAVSKGENFVARLPDSWRMEMEEDAVSSDAIIELDARATKFARRLLGESL